MIVLHASLAKNGLLLWAESANQRHAKAGPSKSRKAKVQSLERLPYDAGAEALLSTLATLGVWVGKRNERFRTAVVWLPTRGGEPIASSPLIAEWTFSKAEVALAAWNVTVAELSLRQSLDLLSRAVGRTMLAAGVIAGQDLAFWATALRLAGSLVARQQYLPGLTEEDGAWQACWEPVLAGEDNTRLADLARRMPAAARAACEANGSTPPQTPPATLLRKFVRQVVDHLVRWAAAGDGCSGEVKNLPYGAGTAPPGKTRSARFDSIHDCWLCALQSEDARMEAEGAECERFAEQLRQWRRSIDLVTAAPVRLCFRLEEPPQEESAEDGAGTQPTQRDLQRADGTWYVRYLLQAADDPSFLLAAEEAWKTTSWKFGPLKRRDFNVQEYLLSSLGQASGLCRRIEESLKNARPAGYKTDATGAYEFLSEKAMALEQAGFGVMLPAWWTRKGTKLRLSVRASVESPKMQGKSALSLEQLVNFQWQVALGDQTLSLQELEALARLKQPLVRLRGQWVEMTAGEIQAALDFWKSKGEGQATVRQVVQMALGADGQADGLTFGGVEASGWIGELLQQLEGKSAFEELDAPAGFSGALRPYQVRGYSWLVFLHRWGLGACLADDMGLGKTVQTLALVEHDWQAGQRRPVLLICPTSVIGNWQKEASRFTPDLPVMVHHGVTRARQAAFVRAAQQQAIVVSSYALLHRDLEHLQKVPWRGVILDEAQNIKNPETKQARAARSLVAEYRLALTGTPVENHVGDLWSIMEFLNPGLLGTQAEFKRRFFIPIQASRDPNAAERLKRITGPFILRRLKTDRSIIADLPEKLEMKVFCTLTKEQASLYRAVLVEAERAMEDSEGIQRKGVILGTLSKLKQVCNHPAHFLGDNSSIPGRSGKLARLTEMLEEIIDSGDRALVFSQFTEMGEILRRHLVETFGREVLFLHGGVPKRQRDAMVERFQSDAGPPIFLLSLKAGGTGLNLTRASHVFHFDRWWNPAVENQATDRAFRIGQTKNVQVHKFLCVGTFEERIDEMIESKKEIAEQVVGAGEGWLTELSNQELKEIFALRKEAVEV